MALLGNGMLITFTEVPGDVESEYNEWYNREHIDERVFMPGFKRARRYVDADGTARIKYFATYETGSVEDLSAPDYMKRLGDQSDWSKKIMGQFSKFERLTVNITVDQTHGISGAAGVVRFFPDPGQFEQLRSAMSETILPGLIAMPGMTGACLAENDLDVSNVGLTAQGKDIPEGQKIEWLVILDGATVEATGNALSSFADQIRGVGKLAADCELETANYLFLFGNAR